MIDLTINMKRLQDKLQTIGSDIDVATVRGMTEATEQLSVQIDEFMLVPLKFSTEIDQKTNETTGNLVVTLDVPRRFSYSRQGRKFDRLRRRLSRKGWADHVQDQVARSEPGVVEAIENAILKEVSK
jgi:hypothetical protein